MNSDCPYIKENIRSTSLFGGAIFTSMGDIKRATKKLRVNPKDLHARRVVNSYRKFRLNCIRTSLNLIRKAHPPANVLISARLKRMRSIQRKISRLQMTAINEMDDVIGFRVVCESYNDAMEMSSRVHILLNAKMKDYLKNKHFTGIGYRARHGIVRFKQPFGNSEVSVRFEIQIRSWFQHSWACWVESYGEQAKEGFMNRNNLDGQTHELIENFQKYSKRIAEWEEANPHVVQKALPKLGDPYHISLAGFNSQKRFFFNKFQQDISMAAQVLFYRESIANIETLLLLGITNEDNAKRLLNLTHPKFMQRGFPEPKYWFYPGDLDTSTYC